MYDFSSAQTSGIDSLRSDARVLDAVGAQGGHGDSESELDLGGGSAQSNPDISFSNRERCGTERKRPGW